MTPDIRSFLCAFLSFGLSCWISAAADISIGPPHLDLPVVTNAVRPAYPPIAAARKVSGSVLVDVQINAAGVVLNASPVCGPGLLREAAKEAAMRWRFDSIENASKMRSIWLIFIFRPVSYVTQKGESDFTPPYQMAVSWEGIAGSIRN